jgi:amidohydrolase
MELKTLFATTASEITPKLIEWRRHIHSNPELSYREFKTMKFICDELQVMGVKFKSGVGETGVVATIEGINPNLRTIALRSDHDALPITESNEVEYCSKNNGVMHACGHDAHTASLLGAAYILNSYKGEWEGTVRLIFQPGEERLPGGATLMVKDGVLKNPIPSHIIGQHVFPDLPSGHIGIRSGLYMASADELHLTINGKGGHAALPKGQTNPLLVASEILLALEELMDNRENKDIKTVLSFGFIEGLGATNVIPNSVRLEGTFRSLSEEWRFEVHEEIDRIVHEICEKRTATAVLDIRVGYPSVYNDPELSSKMKAIAIEYLGEEYVHDLPQRMTAEDFSFYGREIPACFYRFGTSSETSDLGHSGLHTPTFDIDESALTIGAGLMAFAAVRS